MSGLVQDGAVGHGDPQGHDGVQWGRGKPQGHGQDALVHGGEGQESGAQGVEEGPSRCGVEPGGEVPGDVIDQYQIHLNETR